MAHSLVEKWQELLVSVSIEAHAADEEEQRHMESIDEDAGYGLVIDAMAHDNEDDAEALGYVEGDVTILHKSANGIVVKHELLWNHECKTAKPPQISQICTDILRATSHCI